MTLRVGEPLSDELVRRRPRRDPAWQEAEHADSSPLDDPVRVDPTPAEDLLRILDALRHLTA